MYKWAEDFCLFQLILIFVDFEFVTNHKDLREVQL